MKKIFNFRSLFYCFIAFLVAILLAKHIFKTDWIYLIIFIILVFGLLIFSIIRKKIKIYICILVFFTLGLFGYCIEASTYNVQSYAGFTEIEGRVSSSKQENSVQKIVLDKVLINNKEISENIYLFIYGVPYLNIGDVIEFISELDNVPAYYNGNFSSFYYKNNIRYFTNISGSNVRIIKNNSKLNENLQVAVENKLKQSMTPENAALSYAMLFGDKSNIDSSVIISFQASGISHILAISGLHVGIIIAFLYWLLKKFCCPQYIRFIIITLILIFYSYICGFSPSVVRASIMSICFLGSLLLGRKYDALSAIGLAGLIILLINPFSAYDIGFQLSFGCIIGIILFYKIIFNTLKKIKIPKLISSPISISICAQLFILPILINTFGGSSFFSVFINIIIVPIFSIAYIIIFLSTPLLFISSFFTNFLWLASFLLEFIGVCADFVCNLSWSIIPKFELSLIFMLTFYSIIFIFSNYVFLNYKSKILVSISIIAISSLLVGIAQFV